MEVALSGSVYGSTFYVRSSGVMNKLSLFQEMLMLPLCFGMAKTDSSRITERYALHVNKKKEKKISVHQKH